MGGTLELSISFIPLVSRKIDIRIMDCLPRDTIIHTIDRVLEAHLILVAVDTLDIIVSDLDATLSGMRRNPIFSSGDQLQVLPASPSRAIRH